MSRLLLSLCLLFVLSGAQPVIKIGRTISGSGPLAVEGAPITNGIRYWYEYLQNNSNGGIVNNGVFYKIQMVEYDDASAPGNVDTLYRALVEFDNVTATFGPWSTLMVGPAIERTLRSRTPFVFSGASAPQFFNSSYTHSVGTLIQVGQRLLPCVQLYSRLGASTAAIISTSDTFQVTTYGILRLQTAANNITTLFNTTIQQFAAQETFKPAVDQIVALKPDVIFCCQADVDFIPFLSQLRKATVQNPSFDPEKSYQPKAIFNTNSVSATVAYTALSWAADLVFAGDQWAPFLNFTDARFGSTLGFAQTYTAWLRSRGFNYSIGFTDAASVMAGFVMQSALENAASLSKEDIITALHSVNFADTFFGAVRFSSTGELAGTGLCRQLQFPTSAASFAALSGNATTPDTRVLAVVGPDAVRTSNVTYPAIVKPPPQSGLTSSQTTLVIVLSIVGGLLIIAIVVLLIVFLVKREFSIIFIPKSQTNAEWGSSQ